MDWQSQLVSDYLRIDRMMQLCSKKRKTSFDTCFMSDAEIVLIQTLGLRRQLKNMKAIHSYTQDHLLDWFPKLPAYKSFARRANILAKTLAQAQALLALGSVQTQRSVAVDSMPISVAKRLSDPIYMAFSIFLRHSLIPAIKFIDSW